MEITISIQTYNNWFYLKKTLDSLNQLRNDTAIDYEILVINNNCTDCTEKLLEEYKSKYSGNFRYVFEGKQGLSYARNKALEEARGEIISFLDDDVIVDTNWLESTVSAFRKYSATVVGGRSYLIYSEERPKWLGSEIEWMLSKLDYGEHVIENIDKDLYGLNLSMMRKVALDVGGFDISLGRCGNSLVSGEESDLLLRIRARGGKIVYEPGAVVGHLVKKERLTKKWFLKRGYIGAVSLKRLIVKNGESPRVFNSFINLIRCLGSIPKAVLSGKKLSTAEIFARQLALYCSIGTLIESVRQKIKKWYNFKSLFKSNKRKTSFR